jgi:hypothetical protein
LGGWVTKEAIMADTPNTTVLTAEVVRYDDPVIINERVAVAAFIAGYTDPTRRSYATDLWIFAAWRLDHRVNLLNVKRPHLETFARWMEQEGRMPSTIGGGCRRCHRSASTANSKTSSTRIPPSTFDDPRSTPNREPSGWIATNSVLCSCRPVSAISVMAR